MSASLNFFDTDIFLIDRDSGAFSPVEIGDDTTGNLTPYRLSSTFTDTINETTKNGTLLLRAINGLFDTQDPILTDERAKAKYLIEARMRQDWRNDPADSTDTTGNGTPFRFEISDTQTVTSKGIHVRLNLTQVDVRTGEFLDSEQIRLATPKESFERRTNTFNNGRNMSADDTIDITINDNELPDDDRLRQDWLPTEPTTTKRLMAEIIRRVSSPVVIGSGNEDWYYEVRAKTFKGKPKEFDIDIKRFGGDSTDTPDIVIDVDTSGVAADEKSASTEITGNFDNKRYKNILIGKGRKGAHTYPMDFTRAASDITHAKISSSWTSYASGHEFREGDYTFYNNTYLKCNNTHDKDTTQVPRSSGNPNWDQVIPRQAGTSPWTEDEDWWTDNMSPFSSTDHGGSNSDYAGFFHDMNIVRKGYDTDNPLDEFENVSVKDVESVRSAPPSMPKHSQRWIVGSNATGDWVGEEHKIAQWDDEADEWRFSADPDVDGTTTPITADIVNDRGTGRVLRWNGTAWVSAHDLKAEGNLINVLAGSTFNTSKPSPFFQVEAISHNIPASTNTDSDRPSGGINGRDGNQDRPIFFKFNWNVFPDDTDDFLSLFNSTLRILGPFVSFLSIGVRVLGEGISDFFADVSQTVSSFLAGITGNTEAQENTNLENDFGRSDGSFKNRNSRRFGFSVTAPFGDSDGKINDSIIDMVNMNHSMQEGEFLGTDGVGWNTDNSEDLGNVRALRFWAFLRHENFKDQEINGIANVPIIVWFRDNADRVVFRKVTIRAHNAWQEIVIPCGEGADMEQFDSRIDEFFSAFGYTFPYDFYIKERELTGALFNWKFVRGFGVFNAESYSGNFIYTAGQDAFLKIFVEHAMQYLVKNPAVLTGGILDVERVITDHVYFGLDDMHFVKDAYVQFKSGANWRGSEISPDATGDSILVDPNDNPRSAMINITNQFDYINMKDMLRRQLSRFQYHPERQIVECRGDVRPKPGRTFRLIKQKVRDGSTTTEQAGNFVALSVSHITSGTDGYKCLIDAIRKYQPEEDLT